MNTLLPANSPASTPLPRAMVAKAAMVWFAMAVDVDCTFSDEAGLGLSALYRRRGRKLLIQVAG